MVASSVVSTSVEGTLVDVFATTKGTTNSGQTSVGSLGLERLDPESEGGGLVSVGVNGTSSPGVGEGVGTTGSAGTSGAEGSLNHSTEVVEEVSDFGVGKIKLQDETHRNTQTGYESGNLSRSVGIEIVAHDERAIFDPGGVASDLRLEGVIEGGSTVGSSLDLETRGTSTLEGVEASVAASIGRTASSSAGSKRAEVAVIRDSVTVVVLSVITRVRTIGVGNTSSRTHVATIRDSILIGIEGIIVKWATIAVVRNTVEIIISAVARKVRVRGGLVNGVTSGSEEITVPPVVLGIGGRVSSNPIVEVVRLVRTSRRHVRSETVARIEGGLSSPSGISREFAPGRRAGIPEIVNGLDLVGKSHSRGDASRSQVRVEVTRSRNGESVIKGTGSVSVYNGKFGEVGGHQVSAGDGVVVFDLGDVEMAHGNTKVLSGIRCTTNSHGDIDIGVEATHGRDGPSVESPNGNGIYAMARKGVVGDVRNANSGNIEVGRGGTTTWGIDNRTSAQEGLSEGGALVSRHSEVRAEVRGSRKIGRGEVRKTGSSSPTVTTLGHLGSHGGTSCPSGGDVRDALSRLAAYTIHANVQTRDLTVGIAGTSLLTTLEGCGE